jgi:hypothetical protein
MTTATTINTRSREFCSSEFNIFLRRCHMRWALVADIFYNTEDGERKKADVWFSDKNAYGEGYTAFYKIADSVYIKTQGATKMEAAVKMAKVITTSTVCIEN